MREMKVDKRRERQKERKKEKIKTENKKTRKTERKINNLKKEQGYRPSYWLSIRCTSCILDSEAQLQKLTSYENEGTLSM